MRGGCRRWVMHPHTIKLGQQGRGGVVHAKTCVWNRPVLYLTTRYI